MLAAEDLVLGYRIDIRRNEGGWASLCRRAAIYDTATSPKLLIADIPDGEEGQVKAHGATIVEDGKERTPSAARAARPPGAAAPVDDRKLRGDEVVARWDGWSLTCPRPLPTAGRRARREIPRSLPFLKSTFRPLELPELRFGDDYMMRVRIADAAGGGLVLGEPGELEGSSETVHYARHDPVLPPELGPAAGPARAERARRDQGASRGARSRRIARAARHPQRSGRRGRRGGVRGAVR